MSSVMEVGKKLVELSRQHKALEAIDTLYAPNIVSVEAHAPPGGAMKVEGIAAVRAKSEWWVKNHEVHGFDVEGPWPHGDRFIVVFKIDVTPKAGPMAGKRMKMEEGALYTVKDGKVVHEEFFYPGM